MPTSLTLKNVPDAVYERLKAVAAQHRRSLNSQAIVCLETVLASEPESARATPPSTEELLARLRQYRGRLPADYKFDREEANVRERE